MKTKQYHLILYENATFEEYDGDEWFTFGYLRTRLKSDAAARQVLDAVERNGTADRGFESPLGTKARVVISRL
jgi:hypothetical protein